MNKWRVGDVFGWHDEGHTPGHLPNARKQRNVTDTMFPPTETEAKNFQLERCVRVMPHLDDTGGFFIVAVDKIAEMPGDEGGIVFVNQSANADRDSKKNNRDSRDGN
jgi:hypothetical protein